MNSPDGLLAQKQRRQEASDGLSAHDWVSSLAELARELVFPSAVSDDQCGCDPADGGAIGATSVIDGVVCGVRHVPKVGQGVREIEETASNSSDLSIGQFNRLVQLSRKF